MLMALLNEAQRFEIMCAFGLFDKNGNGKVEPQEILQVMNRIGLNPTREQVIEILEQIDLDHNGQVEFSEFAAVMAKRLLEEEGAAEIQMALAVFEPRQGEGENVEMPRLQELLTTTGVSPLREAEYAQFLTVADPTGSGSLPFEHFRKLPCWEQPDTSLPVAPTKEGE